MGYSAGYRLRSVWVVSVIRREEAPTVPLWDRASGENRLDHRRVPAKTRWLHITGVKLGWFPHSPWDGAFTRVLTETGRALHCGVRPVI